MLQVLNSSLNDSTLRRQSLHGLRKVSARCGLLPKSYWIARSGLTAVNDAPLTTGRVSSTHQWLMHGKLVAVKTINLDCVEDFYAFKYVRLTPCSKCLLTSVSVWTLIEIVHQCDHVETTTTSKCGQFPRARFRLSSDLSRISLDFQRELDHLCARAPQCQ